MQPPDTVHNAIAWLVVALLAGFAWGAGSWLFGILSTPGKIAAAVVLCVLGVLLVLGQI